MAKSQARVERNDVKNMKATKRKRQGDMSDQVSSADLARVRKMLPYG